MAIRLQKYEARHQTLWDDFVRIAKNATFLFCRGFMDYHQDRFRDNSLLVFRDDRLVALLPANRVGDTVYSHQGLTYGGLVLSGKAKLLDTFEVFKALLHHLHQDGVKTLEIRVIPGFYNRLPADEWVYFMPLAQAQLVKRDLIMLIDYGNPLGFQKNRREGVNKARRSQLVIKVDNDYQAFWNRVLIPNLKNKHQVAPVHSLAEIELLAERFPDNICQVNVYKDDQIVAGTTLFLTATTVHPQYISATADKNANGSLDYLYDFIIREFQGDRRYFDFNTSSEEDGQLLNKGLIFWKESCGARPFAVDCYRVETAQYKTLHIKLK